MRSQDGSNLNCRESFRYGSWVELCILDHLERLPQPTLPLVGPGCQFIEAMRLLRYVR